MNIYYCRCIGRSFRSVTDLDKLVDANRQSVLLAGKVDCFACACVVCFSHVLLSSASATDAPVLSVAIERSRDGRVRFLSPNTDPGKA